MVASQPDVARCFGSRADNHAVEFHPGVCLWCRRNSGSPMTNSGDASDG
jgi:hypothetical protein